MRDTIPITDDILQRLRTAMGARGLTRTSLARAAGINRKTFERWFKGATPTAQPETLYRVARALDVPYEWLLRGTGTPDFLSGRVYEVAGDGGYVTASSLKARMRRQLRLREPEEPAEEEFIRVPVFGTASAGPGRVPTEHPVYYRHVTLQEHLRDFGAPPSRRWCYWIVEGDSAAPVFFDGELIAVELLDPGAPLRRDEVYVFRLGEEVLLKRIRVEDDGTFVLVSLNPSIPPQRVRPAEGEFQLIGRVIQPAKQQLYTAMIGHYFLNKKQE